MNKSKKFSLAFRERAVRLAKEHRGEYPSRWVAIESIAPDLPSVALPMIRRESRVRPFAAEVALPPKHRVRARAIGSVEGMM
jgi:hypothetical protein